MFSMLTAVFKATRYVADVPCSLGCARIPSGPGRPLHNPAQNRELGT